jgi:prevent-host-death family protein
MKAVALAEPEIVTRNGRPVSVILPIRAYEEMLERLEDAEDAEWLKRARRKPMRYRPLAPSASPRRFRKASRPKPRNSRPKQMTFEPQCEPWEGKETG